MINTVMNGDCLELMKDIPDGSVDMILCDLPYQITASKWDKVIPFEPLWEQYERIIKDNGAIALTASQPFTSALIMSNPALFKYEWIWKKSRTSNPALAKFQPLRHHESILIFGRNKTIYNPQMTEGEIYETRKLAGGNFGGRPIDKKMRKKEKRTTRYPKTVIDFKSPYPNSIKHPTQKPVALFEYLIKTYTNEGDTVLDNCAGSGTTAIAAINTNRNYILMEKEKEYFDIINERIKDHSEQLELV